MITTLISNRVSMMRGIVAALMLISLITAPIGCRRKPNSSKVVSKDGETAKADDDSHQLLVNVVGLLTHDVDAATYEAAVEQLNKFVDRRPGAIKELDDERRKLITQVLGAGILSNASRKQFSNEDIEYLRNGFFLRKISRRLSDSTQSPIQKAEQIFQWSMRETSLVPSDWYRSVPPVELLMRGFGDYRERTWLFLDLLRQSDLLGTVIAVTTKEKPNELVPWLAGMVTEGEVYLFDPVAGLPVRSAEGSIATLKQLSADSKLGVRIYGEGGSPVIDPSQIDKFAILIQLESSMFAPRMSFIESQLSAEDKVNLSIDFNATIERANSALKEIPNNLGVQVWHFPEEAYRGFLAENLTISRPYSQWKSRQQRNRVHSIQGEADEAIQDLVKRDLNPTVPIIFEFGLTPLEVPLGERRYAMNRLLRATPYFLGLAQWSAHPRDLSYAAEWFERYVKRATNWKFHPDDLINVVRFGRELSGHQIKDQLPFRHRLFELLPKEAQAAATKAAEEKNEPKLEPSFRAEAAPLVTIPEPLSEAELSKLGFEINNVLARADLINPETLEKDLGGKTSPRLSMIMAEKIKPDDAEAIGWRNRWAFDVAFAESVVPAERPWLTGAIARWGDTLVAEGKKEEAIKLLRAEYPELAPIQRSSLQAQAQAIEEKK